MLFIKISFTGGFIKCEGKKISIVLSIWDIQGEDSFPVVGLRRNVAGSVDRGVIFILDLTENVLHINSEDCLR